MLLIIHYYLLLYPSLSNQANKDEPFTRKCNIKASLSTLRLLGPQKASSNQLRRFVVDLQQIFTSA